MLWWLGRGWLCVGRVCCGVEMWMCLVFGCDRGCFGFLLMLEFCWIGCLSVGCLCCGVMIVCFGWCGLWLIWLIGSSWVWMRLGGYCICVVGCCDDGLFCC